MSYLNSLSMSVALTWQPCRRVATKSTQKRGSSSVSLHPFSRMGWDHSRHRSLPRTTTASSHHLPLPQLADRRRLRCWWRANHPNPKLLSSEAGFLLLWQAQKLEPSTHVQSSSWSSQAASWKMEKLFLALPLWRVQSKAPLQGGRLLQKGSAVEA